MAVAKINYEKAVFVSYAWGGESERTVDELEQAFAKQGIRIVRDKKDIGYKDSIQAFEQRIGRGHCIISVISDKYLRSEHCMYELVEAGKNEGLRDRIFPIVLPDARIYKAKDRLIYINHWDEQIEQLNQAIKHAKELTGLTDIIADLEKYKHIRDSFDHLTNLLKDINALTPELHAASGYSTLIRAVEHAMAGKQAVSQTDEIAVQPDKSSNSQPEKLSNPFIYGRPVKNEKFIDRDDSLRTVFNRLRNGESSAIIGEPHIGKTSLLKRLTDKTTQLYYLGDDNQSLVFSYLDLHQISNDFSPTAFWEKALKPLQKLFQQENVTLRLDQTAREAYSGDALEELFNHLDENGQKLILILDEFDVLLHHPQFQKFGFYAGLRTNAAIPSFSLVLANRLPLNRLNEYVHKLPLSGGSPVFNYLTEVRLLPLDDKNLSILLSRAGNALSPNDHLFIRFMAGGHPYLVQTLASTLLETNGNARYTDAANLFYERTCSHFDDLWHTLDDRTRATIIVLGLATIGKSRIVEGIDGNETPKLNNLNARLQELSRLGLAEKEGSDWLFKTRCLHWQEEKWRLSAQAFTFWIYHVAITGNYVLPQYDEWLENKGFRSLLTQDQWERLLDTARRETKKQPFDIVTVAEYVAKELTRRRSK